MAVAGIMIESPISLTRDADGVVVGAESIGAFTSMAGLSITVHEASRIALKSSK